MSGDPVRRSRDSMWGHDPKVNRVNIRFFRCSCGECSVVLFLTVFSPSTRGHTRTHVPLTCLPTLLLCSLMRAWMSLYVSRASRKSRENFSPNSTSGLHPPHSQESWGPGSSAGKCSMTPCTMPLPRWMASSCRRCSLILNASSSPRRFSSQLQAFSLPMEQAFATACTTPAAAMAYANALSLKPAGKGGDKNVSGRKKPEQRTNVIFPVTSSN